MQAVMPSMMPSVRYTAEAPATGRLRMRPIVGNLMAWASGIALVLVTLWILIQGYRLITGQSRESLMAVVLNMARIVVIITAATSLSIFSTPLESYLSASGGLGSEISQLVSGETSPISAIDRNMAATQLTLAAIDVVQVAPGDVQSVQQKGRAELLAGFGAASPAMAAGAMLLLHQFTMAIFIGLGPLFILCLIFEQTKELFRKWLLYGIGTLFSIAMQCVVSSIVLKLTENVAAALWSANIVNNITGQGAEGFSSQALQQGGIGLLLTVLVISVPPIAAMFFQGTLGQVWGQSGLDRAGGGRVGPQGQPPGAYGGYGAPVNTTQPGAGYQADSNAFGNNLGRMAGQASTAQADTIKTSNPPTTGA